MIAGEVRRKSLTGDDDKRQEVLSPSLNGHVVVVCPQISVNI